MENKNNETNLTLEELYSYLELNAYKLSADRELLNKCVFYREKLHLENDSKLAQFEINFFRFNVIGSSIFSAVANPIENETTVSEYPSLNFPTDEYTYLEKRAFDSVNPILKARYNHVLWKSPKGIKHGKFADAAKQNYIKSIQQYLKLFNESLNEEYSSQLTCEHEKAASVFNDKKDNSEVFNQLTHSLLFNSDLKHYYKHLIIKNMLQYTKLFKKDDFNSVLTIYDEWLTCLPDLDLSERKLIADQCISCAIKVAFKTGEDYKKYYNHIGLIHLELAEEEIEPDRNWLKLNKYKDALIAFKKADNTILIQETEKKYSELRPNSYLEGVSFEPNDELKALLLINDRIIEDKAKEILELTTEEIYAKLCIGEMFPTADNIYLQLKNKKPDFSDFATVVNFDSNKNIVNDEGSDSKIYKLYQTSISLQTFPLLRLIFSDGIKSGKLTYQNLIEYLIKQSWIGKSYEHLDNSNKSHSLNWVNLLAPSLLEYFMQMEASLNSNTYKPSFILCIDSLSTKIEGLLRHFCQVAKLPTSGLGKQGMEEKFVFNFLDDPDFKKYFNDDDIMFFNYVFGERNGLNIRNNVAHTFYLSPHHYQGGYMILLISVILRLAKYDFEYKNDKTTS